MNNRLYYYLKEALYTPNDIIDAKKLSLKESRSNFALYQLSDKRELITLNKDQVYTLEEQHISVYDEKPTEKNQLGEYHYTGVFADEMGNKVTFHSFFNEQDESNVYDFTDEKKGSVPLDDLSKMRLKQLAMDNSNACMTELHRQYQATLVTLKQQYEQQEQELAKISEEKYFSHTYVHALQDTLTTLQRLSPLDNYYLGITKLLERRIKVLEQELKKTSSEEKSTSSVAVTEEEQPVVEEETSQVVKKTPKVVTEAAKIVKEAINTEKAYLTSVSQLTQATKSRKNKKVKARQKQIQLLLTLHQCVIDADLSVIENNEPATLLELQQIQNLMTKFPRYRNELLTALLLEGNFELATQLRKFTEFLPLSLFEDALRTGNATLLDFLLTHGQLSVNKLQVDNLNPVIYCYKNHSNETSKVSCLSVLIKHGASALVKVDGLPVAHRIFSTMDHPFKVVFTGNEKVFNKLFFLQLRMSINDYIKQYPSKKSELESAFQQYEQVASLGQRYDLFSRQGSKFIQQTEKTRKVIEISRPEIKKAAETLFHDPEVLQSQKRFMKVLDKCLQKQSQHQKKIMINGLEFLARIEDNFKTFKTDIPTKENILKMFNELSVLLEGFTTIVELEKNAALKGSSKKRKENRRRMREIADQIAPLMKKYQYLQLFMDNGPELLADSLMKKFKLPKKNASIPEMTSFLTQVVGDAVEHIGPSPTTTFSETDIVNPDEVMAFLKASKRPGMDMMSDRDLKAYISLALEAKNPAEVFQAAIASMTMPKMTKLGDKARPTLQSARNISELRTFSTFPTPERGSSSQQAPITPKGNKPK